MGISFLIFWLRHKALAISLLCALHYPDDFRKAVLVSIYHGGDSDSTGSITGNLMGLTLGTEAISGAWKENLKGRDLVEEIGEDLYIAVEEKGFELNEEIRQKYPPF